MKTMNIVDLKRPYSLRERMNIYAGTLIGIAAPIVAERYLFFPREQNALGEALAWTGALVLNISFLGIPSIAGGVTGYVAGCLSANRLKEERKERESRLKEIVA